MAELKGPFGDAVIDVPDELVDRYKAAGYTEAKSTSRSTKRTSSKSDDK
jgi:hypothetical protein